jgi:hypothetical protein
MVEGAREGTLHSTPTHPTTQDVHIRREGTLHSTPTHPRMDVHIRGRGPCVYVCVSMYYVLICTVKPFLVCICFLSSFHVIFFGQIHLRIHMVEGGKCFLTLKIPQMCINLVSGMQNLSQKITVKSRKSK